MKCNLDYIYIYIYGLELDFANGILMEIYMGHTSGNDLRTGKSA